MKEREAILEDLCCKNRNRALSEGEFASNEKNRRILELLLIIYFTAIQ